MVAIGSFLIGIFYLGQYGIPLLVEWGSWLSERMGETPLVEESQAKPFWERRDERVELISNILVIIAASMMTFRPSYLARIFGWLQSTGHYKEAEEKS
ncbi:MAG: hypothetical protein ACX939_04670 [Hyphococcus sp.]